MSLLKLIIPISVRFCGVCTPLKLTSSPPPPSTSLSTYNLSCARFTLDEVKIRKPTENTKSESASNRILIVMNKNLARLSSIGRTYSISFNSSNVSIFFWRWVLKHCIEILEKKKEVSFFCSRHPKNVRSIRHSHVVVVQRRQRNVQKSVMGE